MSSCTRLTIRPSVAAHRLFFNYGTECPGSHNRRYAQRAPGLSINLVTGIPAPDLIADGLDVVIRGERCRIPASFPAAWAPCRWCSARQKKLPSARRMSGKKPADLASHSWLEYSVRPDNEFEIIAPEGFQPS